MPLGGPPTNKDCRLSETFSASPAKLRTPHMVPFKSRSNQPA